MDKPDFSQEYSITFRNGWTIYSDRFGTLAIMGRFHTPDEFPDLATICPKKCFVIS